MWRQQTPSHINSKHACSTRQNQKKKEKESNPILNQWTPTLSPAESQAKYPKPIISSEASEPLST